MPQFCVLFYANIILSWRPKGGAWPNAPPLPKYDPGGSLTRKPLGTFALSWLR